LAPGPDEPSAQTPGPAAPERQNAVGAYEEAGFPRYPIAPDGYPTTADPDFKLLIGFGANADRYEGWLSKPLPVLDSLLPKALFDELAEGKDASGRKYPQEPLLRDESADGYFLRGQAPHRRGQQAVHTATDIVLSAYAGSGADAQLAAQLFA